MMKTWETLHKEVITETDKSELLRMDGGQLDTICIVFSKRICGVLGFMVVETLPIR